MGLIVIHFISIDICTVRDLFKVNSYSAKFLKIHLEMAWVDLTVTAS